MQGILAMPRNRTALQIRAQNFLLAGRHTKHRLLQLQVQKLHAEWRAREQITWGPITRGYPQDYAPNLESFTNWGENVSLPFPAAERLKRGTIQSRGNRRSEPPTRRHTLPDTAISNSLLRDIIPSPQPLTGGSMNPGSATIRGSAYSGYESELNGQYADVSTVVLIDHDCPPETYCQRLRGY